ncbi:ABC transporter ATP-binding protein [Synechococcus sp. AH-224-G16]|nr:ABC transporter ATP-binding protein [Synechococcus sp. AH-224-G16]
MSHIQVSNLGKAYKQYSSRWARLKEWVGPKHQCRHTLHWILQDINFTISAGEAIGIIGINGAGKSTLLKLITGTTKPTTGSIHIRGSLAALLELGMGFHPDFTGRQNVYMAGQLLGLSEANIGRLMPEIEAFAEIGDYMDQPVRIYSSGMQVRLAFSVATAQRPEVLIIDEALSVGDAYFQHKSFARIREFRKQGTTLLIVSHDRSAIQSLCDRAILLKEGSIVKDGKPQEVFDFYNALIAEKEISTIKVKQFSDGSVQTSSGTGDAIVDQIYITNNNGEVVECVDVGELVNLHIKVKINSEIESLVLGYSIKDRLGQEMYGSNTWYSEQVLFQPSVGSVVSFDISFAANLGVGSYSITTALHDQQSHLSLNYEWRDLALVFSVVNSSKKRFAGNLWLDDKIMVEE